jgi:hypothetical protein
MAAVKGVQKTLFDAGIALEKGLLRAEVLSLSDSYTCTALEDASTIGIGGDLPEGAKLLGIAVKFPAFATGRTLDVGNEYDDDAFAAALDVSAAGYAFIPCGNYVVGTNAGDEALQLTTSGIFNSETAIQVSALYTL